MKGNGPMWLWRSPGAHPGLRVRKPGDLGPGGRDGYNRMYDPKTVETVSGEVVSVDKILTGAGVTG